MKNVILLSLLCCVIGHVSYAQTQPDSVLPVRGFCIGSPSPSGLNEFIKFIDQELAPRQVNTLILRIDYNYKYESHPELRDENPLSKADIKKLVAVCKKNHIRLIPQFNLLGHQSWAGEVFYLLTRYPQFDETPWVKMPEKYEWPNAEGLYCKSYCPLAPGLHKVVFEVMDELCDVFETTAFHAGMDEVFYIGEEKCPRCGGRDKAELYAGEVATLRNHLAEKGRQLWIWGDRLLDGKTTGLGMWEASMNNTSRAVDLIPKDVMICDWHYDRPEKTPVYFAIKGLNVITCPWRKPTFAQQQVKDMIAFRNTATPEMKDRYQGMMQTVWSNAESFMDEYYGRKTPKDTLQSASRCFRVMYQDISVALGN
ncbi:family 20 glycosylhydrolase [Chitinophaga sancti]|uniref:beta-N-acetylhexosaminidase n=1 Tax=Chitinophaga sancti TaxID=1004 RepID=A0A1K1NAZ2_9BACT|nr:family 20 glycosylhydrolase [Chitinophaga sancti]WQD63404.1 family 20 glycosylhydrolase [Chitinophaga sancti]WQG90970.1 family 20 glycosylhydrolase [Chitinophaga sancti]SFW32421.1 Glycosyl hydrolase family 20, catalytic domain [Chitinophaga sancti]